MTADNSAVVDVWSMDDVENRYLLLISLYFGFFSVPMLVIGYVHLNDSCDQPLQLLLLIGGGLWLLLFFTTCTMPCLMFVKRIRFSSFKSSDDFDKQLDEAIARNKSRALAEKVTEQPPKARQRSTQKKGGSAEFSAPVKPIKPSLLDALSYALAVIYGITGPLATLAWLGTNYFLWASNSCTSPVRQMTMAYVIGIYVVIGFSLSMPLVILHLRSYQGEDDGFIGKVKSFLRGEALSPPVKQFPIL